MSFIFASLFQSSAGRHNQNNSASQPSAAATEENPNDRADDDHHNKHDGHNNNNNNSSSSSDDLLQYVDTVQPPPPPPPPRYFASRNPKGNRNVGRSLSKLFTTYHPPSHAIADGDHHHHHGDNNTVPIPPPSYSQMMMDLMEYIMSIILLELNLSKAIHQHYHDLMTVISQVKATTTATNNPPPPDQFLSFLLFPSSSSSTTPPQHRFANRMSLTAFACDIFQLCPSLGSGSHPHNETSTSALDLPPEGWMELKLRLNNLKQQLLSIHANDDPVKLFSSTTTTTELPCVSNHPVMMMDEQLPNHIMMTTDFDTVMTLLSVQQILASFREQLEDIKEELKEEENGDNHYSPQMNQLVETCVNSFMKNCSELFPPPIVANNKNDEDDDDNDDDDEGDDYLVGEESEHTKMTSNQTGATTPRGDTLGSIPHELVSLALMELYSPKQQSPQPGDHHQGKNMIDRLLYDIQSMILDGRTTKTANDTTRTSRTTMNHDGRFSYANLVDKVRSLLLKWSQSILDVPILVRLGYGGVPSPIVEKDEDDVSSWGSNNHNNNPTQSVSYNDLLTSTTITVDERQQQQRRKSRASFTKALRGPPPRRSDSITAEERDIIARLAATKSAAAATATIPTMAQQLESLTYSTKYVVESPIAKCTDGMNAVAEMDDVGETSNQNDTVDENNNDGTSKIRIPVVRKVVKASRRLLTSFNYAGNANSRSVANPDRGDVTHDTRNDSSRNTVPRSNKKRTAAEYMDANLSITFDDTNRPEIIRRRNNIWAMNQRTKMRMKQRPNNDATTRTLIHLTPIHDNNNKNSVHPLNQTTTTPSRKATAGKSPTSSAKKQQRRTFFTNVEIQALIEGVDTHGVGKWSMIQKNDVRLQGRTPVQLKDKYRHIVAVGLLPSTPSSVTKD